MMFVVHVENLGRRVLEAVPSGDVACVWMEKDFAAKLENDTRSKARAEARAQ